ncbi:MAG: YgfZ/GcvT domain-containing protein [Hyphomonas sp.]
MSSSNLLFPDRAVLRLSGPDVFGLLERTVTHTVENWTDGEIRFGALLTPQGKIIAEYLALFTDGDILLDCHESAVDDLAKRLKMFRLRADVTIEIATDLRSVTGQHSDPRSAELPGRNIVPETQVEGRLTDWPALRIAAGIPEQGSDFDSAQVFPTDVNMDQVAGVDYKKGCFVGQEVASRMKRKGTIRKRTLRIDCSSLEVGADVRCGGLIGEVTSCDASHGLALIRLDRLASNIAKGETVTVNGAPATLPTNTGSWQDKEIAEFTDNAK